MSLISGKILGIVNLYKVSLKERTSISRVMRNSIIHVFDIYRSIAYCGTKQKNGGYGTLLMTGFK
jgi:hypothetical protein